MESKFPVNPVNNPLKDIIELFKLVPEELSEPLKEFILLFNKIPVLLSSPLKTTPVPFTVGRFVRVIFPLVMLMSTPDKLNTSILSKSIALKVPVP